MQSQNCQAIFENGVLRPLTPLELNEGESVTLTISQAKQFPKTGLIAQLTANPIKIKDFQPFSREESHESW
jgi:predicted DNA-binding antitoxin AbrB/MazE fold protein